MARDIKAKLSQSKPRTDRNRRRRPVKPENLSKLKSYQLRFKNYWLNRAGLIRFLKVAGIGIAVLFLISLGTFAYVSRYTPNINNIYNQNLGGSITFYDHTGKTALWQEYQDIKRIPVDSNQISNYMKEATVAIEDKNFYHDSGVNFGSIIRAAAHDILHLGSGLQGASTITEQVAKLNEGWADPLTIPEKIKEVILGIELAHKYSKSQILTAYLNIAPYGNVEYGVQSASEDYFNEPAAQLTLAQAAFLAGVPQAPTIYSPYSSPQYNPAATENFFNAKAIIARQHYVLDQMAAQHMITQAQADAAKQVNILAEIHPLTSKFTGMQAPYFVLTALQHLQNRLGTRLLKQGAWKVITTLNLAQQNQAQNLVNHNLQNVVNGGGDEEAMVVENVPTGQVTAQIGGVNFNSPVDGQINYATIPINPGSTYKLYDYTALINYGKNVGAGSVIYDNQQPLPGYPCTIKTIPAKGGNCLWDYDFQYPGPTTLRYALGGSRDVPAVKAMLIAGEQKTIALSEAMGLKNGYYCYANSAKTIKTTCYASAAIGEGGYLQLNQNVNGFATDSRLGAYIPQSYILQVTNDQGKVVYKWQQPKPQQVVKPDAAYIIDNILSDPNASYLPGSCTASNCTPISSFGWKFQHTNGWDVAIKTGTTHADETGLMMGMTTQYVVGSWVGYHTAVKPLTPRYGGLEGLTEPLTRGMITYLTQGQKPVNWQRPADIKTLPAFVMNHPPAQVLGHYYGWVYPSPSKDIYPSWVNTNFATAGTTTIDKVTGLLATQCTPPLAKEVLGVGANIFSVDTFYGGPNTATPKGSDNIHQCSDIMPSVSINNLTCDDVNGKDNCTFTVTAAQGTHALSGGSYTTAPAGTISIQDGGSNVLTLQIPVNSTSPYVTSASVNNLTPGSTLTAQVVDSVLYSSTSQPVTINATTSSSTNSSNTSTQTNQTNQTTQSSSGSGLTSNLPSVP